jgi:phage-related protein
MIPRVSRDLKPLEWLATSLDDVRAMPIEVQKLLGRQLLRVQLGLEPTDWKPMGTVGPGVSEIRIRTGRAHRVFYVSRFAEAVYVLHAFEKKSQRTDKRDLELGATRYRQLLTRRREQGGQGGR